MEDSNLTTMTELCCAREFVAKYVQLDPEGSKPMILTSVPQRSSALLWSPCQIASGVQ
jgi:hypothetical protein